MKTNLISCYTLITLLSTFGFQASVSHASDSPQATAVAPAANNTGSNTETVVLFRHGEKTAQEYGQLSPKGLNRSLMLPDILIKKYGKPDFLFAPSPAAVIYSRTDSKSYCYVRPLATIEPTAIKLGMPVNTQFGFTDIQHLQSELTQPTYANAVVFVAWEHGYLDEFARQIVQTYGGDAASVPSWPGKDYDTIFVIKLQHSGDKTVATFTVDHEGLDDKLSGTYPSPGK